MFVGLFWLQNPFVVCKLFKKQDIVNGAALEESKSCEVEPAVSSPTVVDEMKSEVEMSEVSPVIEDTKPCDVAESSLVVSSECRSENSAPEVTTTGVRMNRIPSFLLREVVCKLTNFVLLNSLTISIGSHLWSLIP